MSVANIITYEESAPFSTEQMVETIPSREELLVTAIRYASSVSYKQGTPVDTRQDTAQSFYYVEKGRIEVSYLEDETRIIVAMIGAGNFLGEASFFDGGARVRDIVAVKDTLLQVFTLESMERFQQEDPFTYGRFLVLLTRSICAKHRRIVAEQPPRRISFKNHPLKTQNAKTIPLREYKKSQI
ncbi:MAG TPA: cyclic nucleotide-binding domain-containing protein [Desulfobacterales bacterium]|nr:cyclic nucleotide-binding domain-containing protein [Desulfobacterales bacterium]HIP38543.1 cyclic nucleotide-binding domain-containing protein [Desulfocapsa sulfexigens]